MKAVDLSGKKLNRAMGAVTPAEAVAIEQANKPPEKRKVPIKLDARNFAHQVGMDDDDSDDGALVAAQRAFSKYSAVLDQLHEREVTIRSDRTKTAEAHALRVSKLAGDSLEPAGKVSQSAADGAEREIARIDREIDDGFKSNMSPPEREEIRAYVRNLSDSKRRSFLSNADADTLAAVMSGKPFLSGLSDAEALKLRHDALQQRFPQMVKRRAKLEKARDAIHEGFASFMASVDALRDPNANKMQERMDAADRAVKQSLEAFREN